MLKKSRPVFLLMMALLLFSISQILCQSSLAANSFLTSNVGNPYVSLVQSPTGQYVVTVNLRPTGYSPYQKATFYFYFNDNPTGWLVNIGDSSSNNGYGGDGGTQSNDSELQIVNGSMAVYCSDYGSSQVLFTRYGCAPKNDCIRVEISDNKVAYYNYATGDSYSQTSTNIFALNGQNDDEGDENYTIYAGINRVVSGPIGRIGSGVSRVTVFLTPETTPMNAYFGYLHGHTSYSDGDYNPGYAFNYAKVTAGLDFMGIADHCYKINTPYDTIDEWADTLNQANAYTEDGKFVALRGFEWSHEYWGNVTITGTTDFCRATSEIVTFSQLVNWLSTRNCIAIFNHPGRQNTDPNNQPEFEHFTGAKSDKFVGMECWNKNLNYWYDIPDNTNPTPTSPKTEGYVIGDGRNFFEEAINNGWYIGTAGGQDNHDPDWGTMNECRTGVWARSLTIPDILEAYKARRIYTTWDKDLVLSFKFNGNEMGSKLPPGNYQVTITAYDEGSREVYTGFEIYNNTRRICNIALPDTSTSPISVINNITAVRGDRFYGVAIQKDGHRAISSPIFIQ